MRLFIPHILCAAVLTMLAFLGAYVSHTQMSLTSYPLFRLSIGILHVLSVGCVAWVAGVRAIEYHRLMSFLVPLLTTEIIQHTIIETATLVAQRALNTFRFYGVEMQRAKGCYGRQRVVTAVLAKALNEPWSEARKSLIKNQLTRKFSTSWRDYVFPAW